MKTGHIKARVIDESELKKSSAERQAEALLHRLDDGKAIEVELNGSSARTIRRTFSKAASNLGIAIKVRAKDDKVYILLRPRGSAAVDDT